MGFTLSGNSKAQHPKHSNHGHMSKAIARPIACESLGHLCLLVVVIAHLGKIRRWGPYDGIGVNRHILEACLMESM
ncbi:hypothetical protein CRG98_017738 [Punica granatum]|uniref:Uncharacterized protein n=1 Tax=Punica granatum TaxID=22663 RepID=A0A2I0K159_PUNGR|nr:hypothetical protein CRG98_017738 [Punica granatum]